ncbi:hypothetical protein KR032_010581 [Drosophila birchii]|nr:hypothetical protein KR032_010581 [Drosophila birchii]
MTPPSTVFQMLRSLGTSRVHTLIRYNGALGNNPPNRTTSPISPCTPTVSTARNYSSAGKSEDAAAGGAVSPEAAAAEATLGPTGTNSNSQLLSKLFPQTAPDVYSRSEQEQERKDREEQEEKENERAWQRMKLGFAVFGSSGIVVGLLALYELGRPLVDASGQTIEDEFMEKPLAQQYLQRMWKSMHRYHRMIQEPSRAKLLPDPFKHPYVQHRYTLVLEMSDVLVHPDWTYQTGWRFKKRPGVDLFLAECAKEFEIVIFTAEQGLTVFPLLDALDPNGYIMYRLVRDATHFVDGHHVKNLDNLNRDLSKVSKVFSAPFDGIFHYLVGISR